MEGNRLGKWQGLRACSIFKCNFLAAVPGDHGANGLFINVLWEPVDRSVRKQSVESERRYAAELGQWLGGGINQVLGLAPGDRLGRFYHQHRIATTVGIANLLQR